MFETENFLNLIFWHNPLSAKTATLFKKSLRFTLNYDFWSLQIVQK